MGQLIFLYIVSQPWGVSMAFGRTYSSVPQYGAVDGGRRVAEEAALEHRDTRLYREQYFNELLALERRRCERSRSLVLLMLADLSDFRDSSERLKTASLMRNVLSDVTRETDVKGWFAEDSVMGVLFTEMTPKSAFPFSPRQIADKCMGCLSSRFGAERFSRIGITWHVFPEAFPMCRADRPTSLSVGTGRRVGLAAKRLIDIIGSVTAILFFSPVLAAIAVLIKRTSEGPVLFKQERIGLGGKKFMLLKFRTMHTDNDPSIHKEFVKKLISGADGDSQGPEVGPCGTYKIKNDPRVTRIGRMLRKTSLDELPQFINVLKGEMSLVGPRPPIMYECEDYDLWHRHRVLDMKPGITGLWQVTGRSITTFDEMVRMDIRYIREWSLWLDIRIILKTPFVMLMGNGAY